MFISFTWLFCLAFYCWCCMFLTECKTVIVIDSSSSEGDGELLPSLQSHCSDRIKNKDETDIDCGGGKCSKCNDGMMCKANCDCISDICRENKCIPLVSCKDNIRNQDESDVDCGGIICPKCNDTMICKINCDCFSGICRENRCIHIGSCGDKVKNQDESDVDCGGIKCPKCEDGKTCNRSSDCISDFCKNKTCAPLDRCNDGIKNQDETDIDCGGVICPKCYNTRACRNASDCLSNICKNNICVPPETCTDRIKNQDETDVDCGGARCLKCSNTRTCITYSDCISNFCNGNRVCSVGCVPTCKNGGTCISDNNCSCPTGYSGATCEIQSFGLCSSNDTFGVTPILLITFGRGSSQYSSARPSSFSFTTTYVQRFEPVTNDGMFSFVNSVHDDFSDTWHTGATDHTANGGGYMFLVNADYEPGQFYNGTVNNLCVGLRYEFSVYLANLCRPIYDRIKPNVRFEVRDPLNNNKLLARLSSGKIPATSTLTWEKYGLSFTATSSTVVLLMISDAEGGSGNDIVIDDIGLRVCSQGSSGFCQSK